jgi:hypothetical protein
MTGDLICGKLFPESRKWSSQNSSLLTNAISAVIRTSWLCRYSTSKAQGHIPVPPIGEKAKPTRSRSDTSATKGIWRSISLVGVPSVVLPVLVVGVLQRDVEKRQNCAIYGVPPYNIGTYLPRLCRRASPYLSQSLPLQSEGFSHALPELGPHIYVPPLRKAASYSFMNTLPIAHSQTTGQSLLGHEARTD